MVMMVAVCSGWSQRRNTQGRLDQRLLLAHPHHPCIVLFRVHDLPLLVDPPRKKQSLLLANVMVVLLIVQQETLEHIVSLVLAGHLAHSTIDPHSEL